MKSQIFLMGGNPPIKNHEIINKIVSSSKIQRIIIFTVYRDNWKPYMTRYTEGFLSFFDTPIIEYLLLDREKIDYSNYKDVDLIIIGGGNTEYYISTYVNEEFKKYINYSLNAGAIIVGFSAGALLLGDKVYVSPNDNSSNKIIIKKGLGCFKNFLISVHYDSWKDIDNVNMAQELVDSPILPLYDESCLILDKLGNIIEKIV